MPKEVQIPVNSKRVELEQIKARQEDRKKQGKTKYTLDEIGQMLSDVLENQARILNYQEYGKF